MSKRIVKDVTDLSYNDKEVILDESSVRGSYYPVVYQDLHDFYHLQQSVIWGVKEIDLSKDIYDWKYRLNEDERYYIKMVLVFFLTSENIVMDDLKNNFMNLVKVQEIEFNYATQLFAETVHAETYALLVYTFITDPVEYKQACEAVKNSPCIRMKKEWALKWYGSKNNFVSSVAAVVMIEGVFFSGSFCSIGWLRTRGLMPGLTFSNELIARDEDNHVRLSSSVYDKLSYQLFEETIYEMMDEAVAVEMHFIQVALPVALLGMNPSLMNEHIKSRADRILNGLGYPNRYNAVDPLPFTQNTGYRSTVNIFEKRNPNYAKANSMSKDFQNNATFSITEEF